MQNAVQLDPQVLKHLQQQFVRPKDEFTGTWSPEQLAQLQKAYGGGYAEPKPLSAQQREANLEAFNTNLQQQGQAIGEAFAQNTKDQPIEHQYQAYQHAKEALKNNYAHLSEDQQQVLLSAFDEQADVFKKADQEAGFFARAGDALSYIPTTATKLGEQFMGLVSPDGEVRQWLHNATEAVEDWRSDESKLRQFIAARKMAEAKANGESGFTQFFANAVENPLETVGQFAESALPTVVATGAGVAAAPITGGASLALPFLVGGVQGAGETRNNIYDHIMAMPEEQLSQNPQYQALLAKGLSPAQARTELASSFIEHGGEVLATGVSSAVLSGVGGLGRIGQVGKGMLGSTAGKFVSEAVTEPADEVFQQFMGNKAIHDIDPTHSLTDGLGEAAAGGLLFGVAGGSVAAADSAYRTSQQQAKQPEASDDTIDEVISSTKTSEQANQPNQTTNTVQEQALEKVLSGVEDETLRNDYFDELKQDIADGLLEKRVAEGGEYGKLAQAYLNSVSESLDTVQPNTAQQENQSEQELQAEPTTQNSIDEERFSQYSNEVNQLLDGYQQGQLSDTDVSNRYHDIAQRFPDHHTLAAEHYRRQQEDEQQQALYSRSPMKSVEANIARGREAMAKAILDKADVKRGMYNNEFGWVDFVWGDDGLTKPRNKRGEPVGKGISHIIEARMRKNNMSEPEVVEMLTNDIVETIAKGTVVNENPQYKLELDYRSPKNGRVYRATLVRNKGNNAWVLTAFDNSAKYVNEGAIRKGKDKSNPTTIDPTLTRVDRGASFSASGSEQLANKNGLSNDTAVELGRPINTSQLNDTHAHSQRGRGVVAENGPNLTDSQHAVNNKSQTIQDQQALSRILGEETASHIEVVDRNTVKPPKGETVESLASKNVEGWFDVGTQKLYLYSENITATENMTREERLAWVAWHELAHAGMRVKLGYSFHNILKGASEHVVVEVIARKIRDKFGYDEEVAVEEAMAELYAAYETGRWDELGKRYNTSVHQYWRNSVGDWLIKLANYFRRIMGAIVGKDFTQTMTTREVFDTLRGIKEGINALGKKSANQTANQQSINENTSEDTRYSLNEDPNSEFAKAVDTVNQGGNVTGYVNVGTTPDVLKMLGLPDVNVTIHGSTFKKVMQDKHNVTAETLKQLPSQINNPVAVMKSITHDKSYIVLTELVEQENGWNKPIIAALHLKQDKNGLELVNIASVYGRSKSQIQKGLNDDLLYWNNKKGTDFANTFGLQLPAYASLKQSTGSDIKTEADLRQYQSDNSANEIRYSRQSVEDLAATGKAKDDHTSLFQDLISRDVTRLTERWGKATEKLDELFADSLRPVSDWIDNLPALEENGKALIKGRMYRAKNLRDVARSELEAKFMQPLQKELSELAKKYQKDPLSTKRIVGFWASLRYSVIRNQRLLETDKKAVDDAQLALEEAQQSGKQSAIDKAARAYRAAERQYRYRQEDVNSTQFGKGAEDVPFKVGTAGGWSIPEAQAYMAGLEKHIAKADMEKVLANLYAMQKYMLLLDSKSGRYTPEQIKEYMADQYYVPLTGDPNMSEDTGFIGRVGSRSLNISRDKALKGRTASEAEDAFDAVWKAVGKTTTFYGWQPFKQSLFDSYNARVDELTEKGMAEKSAKEQASAELGISVQKLMGLTRPNDNVLIHKDLGEYYEIHLPDNVVKSLKEDNVEVANRWTTWVSKPTRMMARGVTQLTYDFAPKNMFRDTWDKSDLIRDQKIYDKNGKALSQAAKNKIGRAVWFNALNPNKGIWKATNKFARGQSLDINSDNEAERAMAQLVQYGGLSSFTQMIAKTEEDFIQQVRRKGTAKGVFIEQLAGYVEAYNGTFDYVSSLATFKALVDNNVDPEQAASLTLDLSNFRKTGTATKSLKGFFMFLQPKMMGASVLLKSLNTPSGKLRFARQVTASMLIYNALALAFASMFGDDEAGNKLDMLGDITGFIPIPIPWADENSEHKFWKLPLGFGSAQLAWNMAVNVSRAARGSISATDASVNVVTNFGKVFAPVSPSDISASKDPVAKLVLTLTPSIALPVVQLGFNRDAFGRPIHTTFERGEKIKAEQGKANTADAWEHIALSLYDMTGGVIDMYPESVKHLINGYALPLGSFREATNILIENPNREKLGKTQRPVLLRSLVGNVNEFAVQTTFYEAMEEAQATHKAYTRFKETGQLSDWVTPEKMQEVRFYELAQKRTGELRSLKAKRTKALNKGTLSQDAYDKWIREVYVPHTDKVQRAFVNKWRREHGLDTTLQSGTPKL